MKILRRKKSAKVKPSVVKTTHTTFGICIVCMTEPSSHCSIPCGHLSVCEQCLPDINRKSCVYCNCACDGYIKIFNASLNVETTEDRTRKKLADVLINIDEGTKKTKESTDALVVAIDRMSTICKEEIVSIRRECEEINRKWHQRTEKDIDSLLDKIGTLNNKMSVVKSVSGSQIIVPNADVTRKETMEYGGPFKMIDMAKKRGFYDVVWKYGGVYPTWWVKTLTNAGYRVENGYGQKFDDYNWNRVYNDWSGYIYKALRISWS